MSLFRKFFAREFGIKYINLLKGYKVNDYFKLYLSSVYWTRDKVVDYQMKKLKALITYSYKNSDFYRKRIDESGFDLDKFKYPDQLKTIPQLTRDDLRNHLKDIASKEFDLSKCSKSSSSGSTGEPIICYHDKDAIAANRAAMLFIKVLGGYEPGDRWINIWGNPRTVNIEWQKHGNSIKKLFLNEIRFPAYILNNKKQYYTLYNTIMETKPEYIHGYANAIFLFSKYLEEKKEKINFIKGVFTTAENLHDFQRNKIQSFLGSVYDHYSSSETNGIAAQTIYDSYYSILDLHVYVEFGDIIGSGTNSRKILITDLDNMVLPFIKYENGDLAVPLKENHYQSSELNFSKFISIDGRTSDLITLPDGGNLVIPSFFGSRLLRDVEGIKQYQVKKIKNKIVINLLIDNQFNTESEKLIKENLNAYIPPEMNYELVFNQEIVYSDNGKFKLFIDNSSN